MPMMPPPKTESPRPTPGLPLPLLRVGHATAQRKSIWIVSGGPSLRGFDFSILAGQYVLAVNDTFRALPLARGVVSIDAHWQYHRINALRMFSGTKWICRRQGFGGPAVPGAVLMEFASEPGLSETWQRVHAVGTSGYAALNIAYLMRPDFIGLLGFDYTRPGKHWHREYEWPSGAPSNMWQDWGAAFDSTREHLLNVEVVNFSEGSAVTAFPRMSLGAVAKYIGKEN
jgi:hypothetical protein